MSGMFVNLTPAQFQRAYNLQMRREMEGGEAIVEELANHLRWCAEANGGDFDVDKALRGEETALRVMQP